MVPSTKGHKDILLAIAAVAIPRPWDRTAMVICSGKGDARQVRGEKKGSLLSSPSEQPVAIDWNERWLTRVSYCSKHHRDERLPGADIGHEVSLSQRCAIFSAKKQRERNDLGYVRIARGWQDFDRGTRMRDLSQRAVGFVAESSGNLNAVGTEVQWTGSGLTAILRLLDKPFKTSHPRLTMQQDCGGGGEWVEQMTDLDAPARYWAGMQDGPWWTRMRKRATRWTHQCLEELS
jgi:hypothetical protein